MAYPPRAVAASSSSSTTSTRVARQAVERRAEPGAERAHAVEAVRRARRELDAAAGLGARHERHRRAEALRRRVRVEPGDDREVAEGQRVLVDVDGRPRHLGRVQRDAVDRRPPAMLGDELAHVGAEDVGREDRRCELAAEVAEAARLRFAARVHELADAAGQHDAGVARHRDRHVEQHRVDLAAQDDVLERPHEPCDDRVDVAARVVQQRAAERRRADDLVRARADADVPRADVQAAGGDDVAGAPDGRVRRPAAHVEVQQRDVRARPGQVACGAREREPGLEHRIGRDRDDGIADPLAHDGGEPVGVRPPRGEAGDERASREDGRGVEARLGEPSVDERRDRIQVEVVAAQRREDGAEAMAHGAVVQGQATRDRIAREPRRRRQRARGRRADVESEQRDLAHGGDPAHR